MDISAGFSAWALHALFMRVPVVPVTHVVVGVNGSVGSAAALQWAADEAWRRQVGLRVVSAWQQAAQTGLPHAGHPARIAAARVKKALADALSRHDYSHRASGVCVHGNPGEVLLTEAGEASLLALGSSGSDIAQALGPTGRYCLRSGRGPLVFVPTPSWSDQSSGNGIGGAWM